MLSKVEVEAAILLSPSLVKLPKKNREITAQSKKKKRGWFKFLQGKALNSLTLRMLAFFRAKKSN